MAKTKLIIGVTAIIILLTLAGIGIFRWRYDRDYNTLYKDGKIIARHRWAVDMERFYFNIQRSSDINRCNKIQGAYISSSGKRCIFPKNYTQSLSRSLINTKFDVIETQDEYIIWRSTPYYKYGTRGSYAGFMNESIFHLKEVEDIEDFPANYTTTWLPRDNTNYRVVWRVDRLKGLNIPDGKYYDCVYTFDNIKIDLGDDCSKLEFANVTNKYNRIYFYFKKERGEQRFNVRLVDPEVSDCQELDTPGTYTLTDDVQADQCFNISGDNVVIDCDGYKINYSVSAAGYAINDTGGYDNITIKNCVINQTGSHSSSFAIWIKNADNSTIENNTITTTAFGSEGIWLFTSSNNTIVNNKINTSGEDGYGIHLLSTSNGNNISNNVINTSGQTAYGIWLYLGANHSVVNNNTMKTSGTTSHTLFVTNSWYSVLSNNSAITTGDETYALRVDSSYINVFKDTVIDSTYSDIFIDGSGNNNLTNCTFDKDEMTFDNADSNISVNWYTDVYVNDSNGNPISGVDVIAYDNSSIIYFNVTTDATGDITRQEVTEYLQNKTRKYIKTNYTFNATDGVTWSETEEHNITTNYIDINKIVLTITSASSSCGDLAADSHTTLLNDVSADTICFNITGDNVVLDCDGYKINYSVSATGYAVNNTDGYDNITIKNCWINQTSTQADSYGMYFGGDISYTRNNTILNSTVFTYGEESHGIKLRLAFETTVTNCTFIAKGTNGAGLYMGNSDNNFIDNCNMTGNTYGLNFGSNLNVTVNNSMGDNAYFGGINENAQINFTNTNFTGTMTLHKGDFYLQNVSGSLDFLASISTGRFYRYWYVDVYVNDSGGNPVNGADVIGYNTSNDIRLNTTTDATGNITRQVVLEYMKNYTDTYPHTNYTFNATDGTDWSETESWNITQNYIDGDIIILTLTADTTKPLITIEYPANGSSVPNHFTLLNVSVNATRNLEIMIFANDNSSKLNLQDSLVYYTSNATNTSNISYSLTSIPIQHDDDGLVLLMHFDNRSEYGENDSIIYDFAGNGGVNNGSVEGAIWNETGKMGGAYEFDGVDDYIEVSHDSSLSIGHNLTISIWFKPISRGEGGYGRLYRKNAAVIGYDVYINNDDDAIKLLLYNETEDYTNPVFQDCYVMNEWNHFIFTLNETTLVPYCNGVEKTPNNALWGGGVISNTNDLIIGATTGSFENSFNGTLDEFAIYNRTLNSTEIQEIYQLQIEKYYWKVNATDTSGNSNESGVWEFYAVNPTISANFSSSIGDIRTDFYGINEEMGHLSEHGKIDTDGNTELDTASNYTWHREQFVNSNIEHIRVWILLHQISTAEGEFNQSGESTWARPYGSIDMIKNELEYANSLGKRVLIRIMGTPTWLQDRTSSYCNLNRWSSCPPNDVGNFAEMVGDFVQNITNNGSLYIDIIDFEIFNEPYGTSWLNNLPTDHQTKADEYVILYNLTYIELKDRFPNLNVGGPAGYRTAPNLTSTFLSNMTTNMDFVSIHSYTTTSFVSTDQLKVDIDDLIANCTTYSANCSRIIVSEWNIENGYTLSDNLFENEIAYAYSSILNNHPENVTLDMHEWSERTNYTSGSHPDTPLRYEIVMEPKLDNIIYPPYNTTKNFATYHKSGSTVYTSTSDNNDVKVVSSKYGNSSYITIINTDSEQVNITLELINYSNSDIKDMETGTTYTISSNTVEIGLMDGYEVLYLGADAVVPFITVDSPSRNYSTSTVWFNLTLDEEGSWCGYSLDGASNVTMTKQGIVTKFKKQVTGLSETTHTVVFSCNDTSDNFNATSLVFKINAYGCNNGTFNYTCGETVHESCTMNHDLNCTGTGFNIGAANVAIDCDWYNISSEGDGIVSTQTNTSIHNCEIISSGSSVALRLSGFANGSIVNNTITEAIVRFTSRFVNITNNTFTTQFRMQTGGTNNTFTNNTFVPLHMERSQSNRFYSNNITGQVWLYDDAKYNSFHDDKIGLVKLSGYTSGDPEYNNFTNCTIDEVEITQVTKTNLMYVHWYTDVAVNYSHGGVPTAADVLIYDKDNTLHFNESIGADSFIERQTLLEYIDGASGKSFYTNYTMNSTDGTYWSNNTEQVNLTTNFIDNNKIQFFIEEPQEITLTLENYNKSITAELGSDINISATTLSGQVCIDMNHPEYGINYSCNDLNTSFIFNATWFRKNEFNDTEITKNISWVDGGNQTVYINFHKYDDIVNVSINISGFISNDTYPKNVRIYINDTLSNSLGDVFGDEITIETFIDGNYTKNLTFSPGGSTEIEYIKLPKLADVVHAFLNLSGFIIRNGSVILNGTNETGVFNGDWNVLNPTSICSNYPVDNFCNCVAYLNYTLYNNIHPHKDVIWNWSAVRDFVGWYKVSCKNNVTGQWITFSEIVSGEGGSLEVWNATYIPEGCYNESNYILQLNVSTACNGSASTEFRDRTLQWYFKKYPTNVSLETGVVDGSPEWNYIGELNATQNRTSNFSVAIQDYLSNCTIDDDGYCNLPLYFTAVSTGIMNISSVNISYNYDANPISLNKVSINNFLSNSTGNFIDIPLIFSSSKNGTLNISALKLDYAGGNKTYSVMAHKIDYNTNFSHNMTLYYSNWNYEFPQYIDYLEFIPATSQDQNVTPYGQTDSRAILNITTYNYGGKNMDFSSLINETSNCVNLTMSPTNNKTDGYLLNLTWQDIVNNMSYLNQSRLWMWADYNCSYENLSLFYPNLYFRGCCKDCDVCSEDLDY